MERSCWLFIDFDAKMFAWVIVCPSSTSTELRRHEFFPKRRVVVVVVVIVGVVNVVDVTHFVQPDDSEIDE